MKFHTWQFQSFNFIREAWYTNQGAKATGAKGTGHQRIKIIPDCLEMYLTPIAFA
jgi:hypothetical protein